MSQHYDNPDNITYSYGIHDFGAGGDALAIAVPPGAKRCRIKQIEVQATETFNAVATAAAVRLGTASDADKFAELSLGTLANTNTLGLTAGSDELKDNGYGGKGVVDFTQDGENITQMELAFVAPTGGTPAGQGYVHIVIGWW